MAQVSSQIALFGSYEARFDDMYINMRSVWGDKISSYTINGLLDTAPGVPRELPRLEVSLSSNIRITAARSRIDFFAQDLSECVVALKDVWPAIGYRGISRVGAVNNEFKGAGLISVVERIQSGFPDVNIQNVAEFNARFNEQMEMPFGANVYRINFVRQIMSGVHNGEVGFYLNTDVNTVAEKVYDFDAAEMVFGFFEGASGLIKSRPLL